MLRATALQRYDQYQNRPLPKSAAGDVLHVLALDRGALLVLTQGMSTSDRPSPTQPLIPVRPPPPPPPPDVAPDTDPPPDDAEDRESVPPPRAPSRRDGSKVKPYRPTPPGGAPLVIKDSATRITSPSFGHTLGGYWDLEVTS